MYAIMITKQTDTVGTFLRRYFDTSDEAFDYVSKMQCEGEWQAHIYEMQEVSISQMVAKYNKLVGEGYKAGLESKMPNVADAVSKLSINSSLDFPLAAARKSKQNGEEAQRKKEVDKLKAQFSKYTTTPDQFAQLMESNIIAHNAGIIENNLPINPIPDSFSRLQSPTSSDILNIQSAEDSKKKFKARERYSENLEELRKNIFKDIGEALKNNPTAFEFKDNGNIDRDVSKLKQNIERFINE